MITKTITVNDKVFCDLCKQVIKQEYGKVDEVIVSRHHGNAKARFTQDAGLAEIRGRVSSGTMKRAYEVGGS